MSEQKEYVVSPRIKNALLKSSRQLGCRLSEFEKIDTGEKGQTNQVTTLVWSLDNNLRLQLEREANQVCLKQTFNGQPENVPIRWDKELSPALQFSEGVCQQLTSKDVKRFVQQFNLLPLPTVLSLWLQNKIEEAVETGWQTFEEIFRNPIFAHRGLNGFRGSVVKRAKNIHLSATQTVVLVAALEPEENQKEVKIILEVRSCDEKAYLPENLKLIVMPQSAHEPAETVAGNHYDYLRQAWLYEIGEQFSVTLTLNDTYITEFFIV